MESFVAFVNKTRTSGFDSLSASKLIDQLVLFRTIQDTCVNKSDEELTAIQSFYQKDNPWLTIDRMKTACDYAVHLLFTNNSFPMLSLGTKRAFYSFCRQHGYLDQILSCISGSIYDSYQQTRLDNKVETLRHQIPLVNESTQLYSFEDVKNLFLAYTLSSDLLSLEYEAYSIQKEINERVSTNSILQQYIIHLQDAMKRDDATLNTVIVAFLLTYIPAITIKHIPLEKEIPVSEEEHSIRYLLWKVIETYIQNLEWDEQQGYFVSSDDLLTNLFSINPFIIYLCSIFNFDFMKAIMPFLIVYTLYSFETWGNVTHPFLNTCWSCFLRFYLSPLQKEYITKMVKSICERASSSAKDNLCHYFNCII